MIKIFYDKETFQVKAWRSKGRERLVRPGEAVGWIEDLPEKGADAYLFNPISKSLELRPDYVEGLTDTEALIKRLDALELALNALQKR